MERGWLAPKRYTHAHARTRTPSQAAFGAALEQTGMRYVAMVNTCRPPGDKNDSRELKDHIESFERQVREALVLQPLLINSHSGCDSWSADTARAFFERALAVEAEVGALICHETHRGRVLYNPWATRDLCRALPGLKLTADLSHFCVVAERVFDADDADWKEVMVEVARATRHVHARVGYAQGPQVSGVGGGPPRDGPPPRRSPSRANSMPPRSATHTPTTQVPDPRAPEYADALASHEAWWDQILATQAAAGVTSMTVEPEHGTGEWTGGGPRAPHPPPLATWQRRPSGSCPHAERAKPCIAAACACAHAATRSIPPSLPSAARRWLPAQAPILAGRDCQHLGYQQVPP